MGQLHATSVDAWMERMMNEASAERVVDVFDDAFGALARRAHRMLGDVTLAAILDRVLLDAVVRLPLLGALRVEGYELCCDALRSSASTLPRATLAEGLRALLVDFLTVLGSMTAEVLTPALHAQLAAMGRVRLVLRERS